MTMMKWEPFPELMSLREAMDKLFEDSFIRPSRRLLPFEGPAPAIDMYQTDKEVVVKAALPGVKAEEVDIHVTDDGVTIKGERKQDKEVKRENYYYQEHRYGLFSRFVSLPTGLETDKAEAAMDDGVLTLTIPKAPGIKPRAIKVKQIKKAAAKEPEAKSEKK
ncbi:MAG: Hsp20/alpha crystallin family protein [Chloroflexota bacterium]